MGQSCLLEALGGRISAQESASCLIFFAIPNFELDFSMQHYPPSSIHLMTWTVLLLA
jgi:hypothetical protein